MPLAGILRGETGTLRVRLEGVDAVNVNLSSAMVDVAASVVRVGLRGGSGSPGDPQADAQRRGEASLAWDVFNPLWVENQTGQTIVLFAPAGGRQQQVLGDALQPVTCVPVQEATHEGLPQLACKSIGLGLEFPQPSASSPTKPLRARSGEPGAGVASQGLFCMNVAGSELFSFISALYGSYAPSRDASTASGVNSQGTGSSTPSRSC